MKILVDILLQSRYCRIYCCMQQVRDCKQQSALDSNLGIKDFDARVVTEYETAIES